MKTHKFEEWRGLLRIKEHRKRLGLTQQELANRLEVDQSTICHWERGYGITKKYIPKLAALFGCTVEDLIGNEVSA